jgi:hypothetical protein
MPRSSIPSAKARLVRGSSDRLRWRAPAHVGSATRDAISGGSEIGNPHQGCVVLTYPGDNYVAPPFMVDAG